MRILPVVPIWLAAKLVGSSSPESQSPANPKIGKKGQGSTHTPVDGQPFVVGGANEPAIHPSDVDQGGLGDCYLMASLAAIAQSHPDTIRNMIRDNGDGTYTVTFYEKRPFYNPFGPKYRPVEVTVTSEFATQNGSPVFAQTGGDTSPQGKPETWVMLIEKAWAQKNGGYDKIAGGSSEVALEHIAGVDANTNLVGRLTIQDLEASLGDGEAVVAGTREDWDIFGLDIPDRTDKDTLYTNGTLVADHDYYVTSVDAQAGTVTVRNPWGWNRGETTLTWDEFRRGFSLVRTTSGLGT